jgi:hypothetical protein
VAECASIGRAMEHLLLLMIYDYVIRTDINVNQSGASRTSVHRMLVLSVAAVTR